MMMIQRKKYLEWLIRNKNNALIKVISGVRRSGKSTLFELYKEYLLKSGILKKQIIHLNFEDLKYYGLRDFLKLNDYVLEYTEPDQQYYLFFDEIQMVEKFEEVVNSLNLNDHFDIYMTGSNAYFMSGELATLLAGRYVELQILPLSFAEYASASVNTELSISDIYDKYKKTAFPYLVDKTNELDHFDYLRSTYNDIAMKDIVGRYGITETDLLERVLRFLAGQIGSEISINNIVNKLKSDHVSTSNKRIERYVDAFLGGLILYRVPRYDIKGKKLLQRLEKYYVVDLGFRHLLLPDAIQDDGHILENIIFLELKRRYRHVYVGKNDRLEVDFVCFDDRANPHYYQVVLQTMDEKVLERELRSLRTINDQHPKYLITLDWINKEANYDGIKKVNALNWLIGEENENRRFDFNLPEELIAQTPLEKRDDSRLMVLDVPAQKLKHRQFTDITRELEPGDALVLNDTKVMPARLLGTKEETGATIEILLLTQLEGDRWEVLIKPAKRVPIGTIISFGEGKLKARCTAKKEDGQCVVEFQYNGIFYEILDELGEMPLPPYITEKLKDQDRYQTVYGKEIGAAAASTAGLHFTEELLAAVEKKGVHITFITLHIGIGTFRPVKVENVVEHDMHAEFYRVSQETSDIINETRSNGGRIICVGTSAVRLLETLVRKEGGFKACEGWTDIFIYPGFEYKAVDGMVTNFHLPKSTLIMMIAAFAGKEFVMKAYQAAIEARYRFFSFGDAMLIKCK